MTQQPQEQPLRKESAALTRELEARAADLDDPSQWISHEEMLKRLDNLHD